MGKVIQIFGERVSGTNYLQDLIEKNALETVTTDAYGHKHMFNLFKRRKTPDEEAFYIFMYRNPYDWLRSINLKPHHTQLWDISFSDFIRRVPWVCDTYEGPRFQNERQQVFERYEGGVLEVRNSKNKLFDRLSYPGRSAHIRYEDLRRDPEGTLRETLLPFDIMLKPKFENVTTTEKGAIPYSKKQYHQISQEDLDFINANLDWMQETRLGYHQIHDARGLDHTLRLLYG